MKISVIMLCSRLPVWNCVSYCSALTKFVNKAADGGITALHMAAVNGYFDCVQLLLNFNADVSAVTFDYGTTMDLIGTLLFWNNINILLLAFRLSFDILKTYNFTGAGSTPLHYAAYGGNLKCCQVRV